MKKGKENGVMNTTILKIVLSIVAVAGVGCIAYGVTTLQNDKDLQVQQAATQIEIQVQDKTTPSKTTTEQVVDKALAEQQKQDQWKKEAEQLYEKYKEELICDKNTFISKYIQYRGKGLSSQQAYDSIYNEFAKVNQIQVNEVGEMDAQLHSLDENVEEPIVEETTVVEEAKIEYEVIETAPEDMYAVQDVNLRNGPDAEDFDKIGSLAYGDKVTVVGIVKLYNNETCLWYKLSTGEFASGAYLLKELPQQKVEATPTPTPEQQTPSQNQEQPNPTPSQSQQGQDGSTYIKGFKVPGGNGGSMTGNEQLEQATVEGSGGSTSIKLH